MTVRLHCTKTTDVNVEILADLSGKDAINLGLEKWRNGEITGYGPEVDGDVYAVEVVR